MIISAIVAYTKDSQGRQIIGKDNKLPWKISQDMEWFKECTLDSAVLMGRKTYESIGRPLPRRDNYVISRDPQLSLKGVYVCQDPESAIAHAREKEQSEIFIIGGQQIYECFINRVDRLYVTYIKNNPGYEGDTFFPDWDRSQFKVIQRDEIEDPVNGRVTFKIFQRHIYSNKPRTEVDDNVARAYQSNTGSVYGYGI